MRLSGRSLELRGDAHPRGMTVLDRTRLNGRLFFSADAPFEGGEDTPTDRRSRSEREGKEQDSCADAPFEGGEDTPTDRRSRSEREGKEQDSCADAPHEGGEDTPTDRRSRVKPSSNAPVLHNNG